MASLEEWLAATQVCWCQQLGDTVAQCCETAGVPVVADCCAGVAWVRLVNSYPADGAFTPKTRPERCWIDTWVAVIEVGVTRCAPADCGGVGNMCCESEAAAAALAREDFARFRRVYSCCLPGTEVADGSRLRVDEIVPGSWQVENKGGCITAVGRISVFVSDYCAC